MADGEYISLHIAESVQSFLFALQFEVPRLALRKQFFGIPENTEKEVVAEKRN